MKWARLCWKMFVPPTTIRNCFGHTGLFDSKHIGTDDEEGDGYDVESSVQNLNILYPGTFQATDIDYNPPDEHDLPDVSDKDSIIEHVISTARTGNQSVKDEEKDSADSQPAVPIQQRIEMLQNVLSNALIMHEELDIALERLIKRKISSLKAELTANARQKSLRDYFHNEN
ncbi:hypothetical protein BCR43DRAFT_492676 [Syncephalastrum racemosum]|uniref:Uncharacterized protein n=1 Tax=Syncephalastrum racemosum TaxID=13706 RepID=A0A1X2H9B7_SYNRA|nr:hypothetical protein BCR43DRAFT_492676 [Syncephalastrum racemosum]